MTASPSPSSRQSNRPGRWSVPATNYGTWISRGPDGQTATLVFAEDGTFQGKDLPGDVFYSPNDELFPDAADWKHLTERHGTWTTKWDRTIHEAFIVRDTQFMRGETLSVFGSGQGKTLSVFIGDCDSWVRLVFERADRMGVEATANTG